MTSGGADGRNVTSGIISSFPLAMDVSFNYLSLKSISTPRDCVVDECNDMDIRLMNLLMDNINYIYNDYELLINKDYNEYRNEWIYNYGKICNDNTTCIQIYNNLIICIINSLINLFFIYNKLKLINNSLFIYLNFINKLNLLKYYPKFYFIKFLIEIIKSFNYNKNKLQYVQNIFNISLNYIKLDYDYNLYLNLLILFSLCIKFNSCFYQQLNLQILLQLLIINGNSIQKINYYLIYPSLFLYLPNNIINTNHFKHSIITILNKIIYNIKSELNPNNINTYTFNQNSFIQLGHAIIKCYLKLLLLLFQSNPPEVQSTSLRPAESSPPEVTTSPSLAESSSNYLSLKSNATPGDRGEVNEEEQDLLTRKNVDDQPLRTGILPGGTKNVNPEERGEGSDGSSIMGMMEDDAKGMLDVTSSGLPAADLREAEGQLNRRGTTPSGKTSGGTAGGRLQVEDSMDHLLMVNLPFSLFEYSELFKYFMIEMPKLYMEFIKESNVLDYYNNLLDEYDKLPCNYLTTEILYNLMLYKNDNLRIKEIYNKLLTSLIHIELPKHLQTLIQFNDYKLFTDDNIIIKSNNDLLLNPLYEIKFILNSLSKYGVLLIKESNLYKIPIEYYNNGVLCGRWLDLLIDVFSIVLKDTSLTDIMDIYDLSSYNDVTIFIYIILLRNNKNIDELFINFLSNLKFNGNLEILLKLLTSINNCTTNFTNELIKFSLNNKNIKIISNTIPLININKLTPEHLKIYTILLISTIIYNKHEIITNNNILDNEIDPEDIPPEVQSTSVPLADSSPLEVQSTSVPLAESSLIYLSPKSRATPRDRGEGGVEGSYVTSSGLPVADLREAEGQLNRGATTASGRPQVEASGKTSCVEENVDTSIVGFIDDDLGLYPSLSDLRLVYDDVDDVLKRILIIYFYSCYNGHVLCYDDFLTFCLDNIDLIIDDDVLNRLLLIDGIIIDDILLYLLDIIDVLYKFGIDLLNIINILDNVLKYCYKSLEIELINYNLYINLWINYFNINKINNFINFFVK